MEEFLDTTPPLPDGFVNGAWMFGSEAEKGGVLEPFAMFEMIPGFDFGSSDGKTNLGPDGPAPSKLTLLSTDFEGTGGGGGEGADARGRYSVGALGDVRLGGALTVSNVAETSRD